MNKNFIFYRCFLERGIAGDGEPGLLAATEVVQAVCDAGFQRNGLKMKCYPSSPHCYYKYAKTPREGMYMMRAVKKSDMTTLDILIDTRLYPSFVMIEKHKDWQEETEEVKNTLEQVINDDADKYNWHINLREHNTSTTQHLEEFISALSYIKDKEDVTEKHKSNVQIGQVGQLILKVNGNNYYHEGVESLTPDPSPLGEGKEGDMREPDLQKMVEGVNHVRDYFWGDSSLAVIFCVCRDCYGYANNMSQFERDFHCSAGLLSNAFRNNPYMRLNVSKWEQNGVKARVMRLVDAYKEAVETS